MCRLVIDPVTQPKPGSWLLNAWFGSPLSTQSRRSPKHSVCKDQFQPFANDFVKKTELALLLLG